MFGFKEHVFDNNFQFFVVIKYYFLILQYNNIIAIITFLYGCIS